jgi:hypothetical protein
MEKVERPDADKSEWTKLEFLMDPGNPASKYSQHKWVMAFCEVKNLMPMKEPVNKTRMFRTLMKRQAFSYFKHHYFERLESLEKIRCTNGSGLATLPGDNKKRVSITSNVVKSSKNPKAFSI